MDVLFMSLVQFTVVCHTEATPPVARGRSTNHQGGIRTNPPTQNPSPLAEHIPSSRRITGLVQQLISASPLPARPTQQDEALPALGHRQHGSRNSSGFEDEGWETLALLQPNFHERFRHPYEVG